MASGKIPLVPTPTVHIVRHRAFARSIRASSTFTKPTSTTQHSSPNFSSTPVGNRHVSQLYTGSISTPLHKDDKATESSSTALQRMPTSSLLRSILLGSIFTRPRLVKMALPVMNHIANSQSILTSPDRNPILKFFVKHLVYDQFCAGVNGVQTEKSRQSIKNMGFAGIILCCGREVQVSKDGKLHSTATTEAGQSQVAQWRDGNLETIDMIGDGDWIGMKTTGAGTEVTEAMMKNEDAPQEFVEAMDQICQRAQAKNARIWIDAEQQVLQTAIDRWTIDVMRKYNRNGKVLVYNTVQAYLKSSRDKLMYQLSLADKEGWSLGVKLVRGAYIGNDQREKIHDTKADTDASYNGIVRDLLQGTNLGFAPENFPKMQLFLAGHNAETVRMAADLVTSLSEQKRLKVLPDFGQLQGMADFLGCELLEHCDEVAKARENAAVPKVYKCLTWGSVQECIQYLFRRMVENTGASERMKDGLSAYSGELRRRIVPFSSRR